MTCTPQRLPHIVSAPRFLLSLAVVIYVVGRMAAICGPGEFDSFLYSVSAYKVWQPGATVDDLVSEKPAGQPILTGWCYRLAWGRPSRLTLVPIESAFLLGAYGVFWLLARRLFGRRVAAFLTFFFVIAHNVYSVNDGFNLNESYLALPSLLAVLAHLTMDRPLRRGFVRGIGLGLALTIKQTAVGLPLVCLLHGLVHTIGYKRWREGLSAFAMTWVGMTVAWAPVVVFLSARGWLRIHLHDLMTLSGRHASSMPVGIPDWDRLSPVLPLIWWSILGMVGWLVLRTRAACRSRDASTAGRRLCSSRRSAVAFAWLWFSIEAVVIWAMVKPWAHYYEQIVAPAALLAGFGITTLARSIMPARTSQRMATWRWVCATTGVLTMVAAMPLLVATPPRIDRLDREMEIKRFEQWLDKWSCKPIGEFFREIGHET